MRACGEDDGLARLQKGRHVRQRLGAGKEAAGDAQPQLVPLLPVGGVVEAGHAVIAHALQQNKVNALIVKYYLSQS